MTESQKPRVLAYLALGVGVISLGLAAIFVRWADAPGTVTSFYRLAIAVTLLSPVFYRRVRTHGKLPWSGVRIALLGGLFFAGDLGFWASGVVLSGALVALAGLFPRLSSDYHLLRCWYLRQ